MAASPPDWWRMEPSGPRSRRWQLYSGGGLAAPDQSYGKCRSILMNSIVSNPTAKRISVRQSPMRTCRMSYCMYVLDPTRGRIAVRQFRASMQCARRNERLTDRKIVTRGIDRRQFAESGQAIHAISCAKLVILVRRSVLCVCSIEALQVHAPRDTNVTRLNNSIFCTNDFFCSVIS